MLTVGGLPPILNGFSGLIKVNGTAQGSVAIPNNNAFLGIKLFVAFIVLDGNAPSGVKTISNSLEILLQ